MQTLRRLAFQETHRTNFYHDLAQLLRQPHSRRTFLTSSRPNLIPRTNLGQPLRNPCKTTRTTLRTRPQSRFNSSKPEPSNRPNPDPTPNLGSPEPGLDSPSLSLSQRFRKLSREYGWSAVAVYFGLSLLDFPFCFLAVRLLGTERIGHWEHVIVGYAWRIATLDGRVGTSAKADPHDEAAVGTEIENGSGMVAISQEGGKILEQANQGQGYGWGVEEAETASQKSDASKYLLKTSNQPKSFQTIANCAKTDTR